MDSYLSGKPNNGIFDSKNLSLFAYVAQNPVKLIDPNGLQPDYPDNHETGKLIVKFGVHKVIEERSKKYKIPYQNPRKEYFDWFKKHKDEGINGILIRQDRDITVTRMFFVAALIVVGGAVATAAATAGVAGAKAAALAPDMLAGTFLTTAAYTDAETGRDTSAKDNLLIAVYSDDYYLSDETGNIGEGVTIYHVQNLFKDGNHKKVTEKAVYELKGKESKKFYTLLRHTKYNYNKSGNPTTKVETYYDQGKFSRQETYKKSETGWDRIK